MKHSMRKWHNWASVALGVPLLLVGLTTVFIAHEQRLGTKEIVLPISGMVTEPPEVRAAVNVGGAQWLSTRQGVYRLEGDRAVPLAGSPADEIRDMLVSADQSVLLAGKKGLWRYADGQSSQLYKADCWQIAPSQDGYTAACKDEGLLFSADGQTWAPRRLNFPKESADNAKTGMPLSKIIMDIHTGKLFFGKQYEWIWIDLLGVACVGLGLTGLVMWMRGRRLRAGGS
ncbi:MAG: PepSY domain-containing protein [Rhodocyclaceae bacterium]